MMTANRTQRIWLTAALLALMLALAGAILPSRAWAQADITLETVTVRVWPEFDQPSVLVFYVGDLPADTTFPVDIRIPIPSGVDVNAVAYTDETTGELFSADYEVVDGAVTMSLPGPTFWIEFYDDLTIDGDTRQYEATWTSPYPVETLIWEIELPVGGTNLELDTGASSEAVTDPNGLPAFRVTETGVDAGETAALAFTYTKADDALSIDQIQPAAAAGGETTATPPPASSNEPPTWLVILLLLVGLGLVGLGVWWFLRQSGSARPSGGRRAPGRRSSGGGGARFCTKCGARAQPGDKFCRECGTKLRT
jgi:hypothetical protein